MSKRAVIIVLVVLLGAIGILLWAKHRSAEPEYQKKKLTAWLEMVDQEIVLLHGFIKKQQKTPPGELELARKRKKQYLQNL